LRFDNEIQFGICPSLIYTNICTIIYNAAVHKRNKIVALAYVSLLQHVFTVPLFASEWQYRWLTRLRPF